MAPKRSLTITTAWIGVIGAAIIAIVTIAAPRIENNSSQEFEYIGRVIDNSTQLPITGGKVTLDLQGVLPVVCTDSEGIYRFKVTLRNSLSGQLTVDAQGYQSYTRSITLARPVQTIDDIRLIPVPQLQVTETPTPIPTFTSIVASAPIIDSIDIPDSIVCDRRKYDVLILFHDLDGDAHRIEWELLYSKKQTVLYTEAKEFAIDSESQKQGAIFFDFIQWYIPGDEVKIRVHIKDRSGLSGSKDFEFKCLN